MKLPSLIYFSLYFVIIDLHNVSLISRNTQSPKQIDLNFIRWSERISEDEKSNLKFLKMLSETKCLKPFSNDFT